MARGIARTRIQNPATVTKHAPRLPEKDPTDV
jgi:hypothetical protein